ncbi:MAG: type III-B CRISPR-associated protein Cas10/Cmr2 [Deltaproteobacteria bacterium]|nr:type III-B CRISPR-associated protein Cas10/Cmr2 [Deltaproteobacteria bacterium]
MQKWLALFQIGPVQEFIQTARKTQDYWTGSYLLSCLCEDAIKEVGTDNVIFPAWATAAAPGSASMIPNRFLAVLGDLSEDDAKCAMKSAANKAKDLWTGISEDVAKKFEQKTGCDVSKGPFAAEWKNQIDHAFEFLWVLHPWDGQDSSYSATYQALERLMGSRKASRWFEKPFSPGGPPCSLCGQRLAVLDADPAANPPPQRRTVWEDWKNFRTKDFTTRFRDNERLCAVCLVKRLAPDCASVFKFPRDVPSTSSIAVAGFLKATLPLSSTLEADWNTFKDYLSKKSPVPKAAGEPWSGHSVPGLTSRHPLAEVEGDWLIEDTYERLKGIEGIKGRPDRIKEIDELSEHLKNNVLKPAKEEILVGNLRSDQMPSKYFAVLTFDGDSMGSFLAGIKTPKEHRSFSLLISNFAHCQVPKIIESDHAGFLAYAGGDEGLAFLPLGDLLSTMSCLRSAWEKEVRTEITKQLPDAENPPTLSVGAVIAHHQQGLGRVIEEAFAALEQAKDFEEKDAFAVNIIRRSGAPVTARSRWVCKAIDTIDLLKTFVDCYHKAPDGLSTKWYRDAESMAKVLGDPPTEMSSTDRNALLGEGLQKLFAYESRRLLMRHDHSPAKENAERLAEPIASLRKGLFQNGEGNPFRGTMNLMDLAQFIADGGVR